MTVHTPCDLPPRSYRLKVRKPKSLSNSLKLNASFWIPLTLLFVSIGEGQSWMAYSHPTNSSHGASLTLPIGPFYVPSFLSLFGQYTILSLVCFVGYDTILGKTQTQLKTQIKTPVMFWGIFQSMITIKITTFPVTYWKRYFCSETLHLIYVSTCISRDWCISILVFLFNYYVKNFKTIAHCLDRKQTYKWICTGN